jgi:hypothetical protein
MFPRRSLILIYYSNHQPSYTNTMPHISHTITVIQSIHSPFINSLRINKQPYTLKVVVIFNLQPPKERDPPYHSLLKKVSKPSYHFKHQGCEEMVHQSWATKNFAHFLNRGILLCLKLFEWRIPFKSDISFQKILDIEIYENENSSRKIQRP